MTGNEPQVKFPIGRQINNSGCTQRTFAGDSEWTLATVPSLHTICLEHIADNFAREFFSTARLLCGMNFLNLTSQHTNIAAFIR